MQQNQSLDNNDFVALLVTWFVPGAGHMMLGQTTKGLAILAANFLTCGGLGLLWVFTVVDAYFLAMARKKRPVGDWEFLPK
jgi:TM2 domain-containing membrane protein YozV